MTHNLSVNRIACNLRLQIPSALRAPAAGYLKRCTLSTLQTPRLTHIIHFNSGITPSTGRDA